MADTLNDAGNLTQEQLGARIRIARKSARLSMDDLAKRLGVTAKTVRGWEKTKRVPRANQIIMMAGVLNVSASWLLEGRVGEPLEDMSEDAVLRGKLSAARLKLSEATELILEIESQLATR